MVALLGCGGGTSLPSGGGGTAGGGAGGGPDSAADASGVAGGGATAGARGTAGVGGAAGSGGSGGVGRAGASAGSGPAGRGGGVACKPDVLLIQDRSGSMNEDENGVACNRGCVNSKWSYLTTAVNHVVVSNEGSVNWGLKYFPDDNACGASMPPAVAVGPMNAATVAASIAATAPGGDTPTRDAITTGAAYLLSLADGNPKFIVLATDGLPNCPVGCAAMSRPTNMCTQTDNPIEDAAVEAAIDGAVGQGIKTFVIGIGNVATAESTLNALAIAGGEAQVGASTSYYPATDEAALEAALTTIVAAVGCP
ncbi:MAG: vWA domain-containing protein [Polyangia bacterium]